MKSRIIGIDLGTTNSCVSIMDGGQPRIIGNAGGERTVPSVISFKGEHRYVGEVAKRQATTNLDTVFSIKTYMGEDIKIQAGGREYSPQELSAMILSQLKMQAESYLDEEVTRAVIAVPAYFNDAQRQATRDAGRIAGLVVERIINEPTAAALAYGLDKGESEQIILVYDFGGGTFDTSILELDSGLFQVKATAGNSDLGGNNLDQQIIEHVSKRFKEETGIDLASDRMAQSRLRESAEMAKKELSFTESTQISLPFIAMDKDKVLHLDVQLTRKEFEDLSKPIVQKTIGPMRRAVFDAGLEPEDIDKVILVGGSTRIPSVVQAVKDIIGIEPTREVNLDEVVAVGAAIQAGVLEGAVKDFVLVDVVSLSIGIETTGGVFTKVIPRNTSIPVKQTKIFTTTKDNQSTVEFKVFQGERAKVADNKSLGQFKLEGIQPATAGVPQIEVGFSINSSGIVSVSARDLRTNRKQEITITTATNLSEKEIERMVKQAKDEEIKFRAEAKKAELLNEAYDVITKVNANMEQHGKDDHLTHLVNIVNQYTYLDDVSNLPFDLERLRDLHHQYLMEVTNTKKQ